MTSASTNRLLIGLVFLAGMAGCGQPDQATTKPGAANSHRPSGLTPHPDSAIRFEDIAEQSGIRFVPKNGREAGRFTILESLGTGVAISDLDGDAQLDIIAPGGGTFDDSGQPVGYDCGVFRQRSSLQFNDVAGLCGIGRQTAYTHGVAVADWDNDGFDDVVITGFRSVRMYHNVGDGTYIDVTSATGVRQDSWSTSAAFLDADNDGSVELYVVNYVDWQPGDERECVVNGHRDICPPSQFNALSDYLYRNRGDGTFSEISQQAGLSPGGKGLAVITGDVDLDGDSDIYVANDTTANLLYLNDGNGMFVERGLISGCALGATTEAEGSMGVDFADFNKDGYPDIWVSNYENQSFAMYQSRGPGIFQHVSSVTGISAVGQLYVGFGTVAFDADLDGDVDMFAANGHVMYETGRAPVRQMPLCYENLGENLFRNVAQLTGDYGRSIHMGRGVAAGDLDQDGRVDLVVSHINEPVSVLHNTSRTRGSGISLELVGRSSNRSAAGAFVRTKNPESVLICRNGGSYLSDSADALHFGTENADSRIEIQIFWPSGIIEAETIEVGTTKRVVEPLASP